jgi:hypothetical protein
MIMLCGIDEASKNQLRVCFENKMIYIDQRIASGTKARVFA